MKRNVHNILRIYDQASADEIRYGLEWYDIAHSEALNLARIEISAPVIAAVSPGLRWERNIEAADRLICGESLDGLGIRWYDGVRKAERIIAGENPAIVLKGNKVRAFWQCILEPDNKIHVCVDGHAYAIWSGKRITTEDVPNLARRKRYQNAAKDYVIASKTVGILPMQIQAITWVVWRRIHASEMKMGSNQVEV